jgi:hypothetical protein
LQQVRADIARPRLHRTPDRQEPICHSLCRLGIRERFSSLELAIDGLDAGARGMDLAIALRRHGLLHRLGFVAEDNTASVCLGCLLPASGTSRMGILDQIRIRGR